MKITELKGKSQVFTLKDGTTLRIFARETKKIAESNISNELRIAENMGLIILSKDTEVPKTNKKLGGTK